MPTHQEVRKREFRKVMRGVDATEVHTYLQEVAASLESLQRNYEDVVRSLTIAETRLKDYESVEKTLHDTLAHAQEASGKTVENARKEAELIIRDAELKAAQILEKSRNDLTALKEQIIILKAKKDSLVARLKMLLTSELDLVTAIETSEDGDSSHGRTSPAEQTGKDQEIEEIIKNLDNAGTS